MSDDLKNSADDFQSGRDSEIVTAEEVEKSASILRDYSEESPMPHAADVIERLLAERDGLAAILDEVRRATIETSVSYDPSLRYIQGQVRVKKEIREILAHAP